MEESDNESSSVKDLVPLDWFTQKQEYRLFDYILENIDYIIDDLEEKNRIISLGLISSNGGNFKGAIRSLGDFRTQDDFFSKGLNVIGRSLFKGLVIVDGSTMILGRSKFLDHCILGGKSEIAGDAVFKTHILTSGELKLGGDTTIEGNVYSDSPVIFGGRTELKNIRSTSRISARTSIIVKEDIQADEFIFSKGRGEVQNITARFVTIGFKDRISAKMYKGKGEKRQLINPINLLKFVTSSVKHVLSRYPDGSRVFHVFGNINADEIYLSNCIVHGDIKANKITIGPDVSVSGMIEYSEFLKLPKENTSDYKIKQIESQVN